MQTLRTSKRPSSVVDTTPVEASYEFGEPHRGHLADRRTAQRTREQVDLDRQLIDVVDTAPLVPGRDHVAAAVRAQAPAERDVHVQRHRGRRRAGRGELLAHGVLVHRTELGRGRVAGVARATARIRRQAGGGVIGSPHRPTFDQGACRAVRRRTAQAMRARSGRTGRRARVAPVPGPGDGTSPARDPVMDSETTESWTLPFHVVIWTTLLVAAVMVMVVALMH